MPFTAAHPAIILPLKHYLRRYFSTTGLVIGSISPDFEYFLAYFIGSHKISHTLKGIFIFDLPVSVVLAILFHGIVRRQIIPFLPPFLGKRAIAVAHTPWFGYLARYGHVFLFSVLVGAASHVFWDSFTHYSGYFVKQYPVLLQQVDVLGFRLPLSRVIQHTSTFIGLTAVYLYIRQLPVVCAYPHKYKWLFFWVLVVLFGLVFLLLTQPMLKSIEQVELWVVRFLSGCLQAILLLTVALALFKFIRSAKS